MVGAGQRREKQEKIGTGELTMQNDMRDRLVELIKQSEIQDAINFFNADLDEQIDMSGGTKISVSLEFLADYLIESGVQEIKHGYWHLLDDCANEGVYCSVCNKKVYKTDYANQKIKSKYCPNCGAKMDGVSNG